MASGPPPDLAASLRALLRDGVRSEDIELLRERLDLPADAGEVALAGAVVRALGGAQVDRVTLDSTTHGPGRDDDSRVIDGRTSFLMRMTAGAEHHGMDIERMEDVRTLLAVLRAGKLGQRRAATLRLGQLLERPRNLASDQVRTAIDTLIHLRKFSIAYELSLVCSRLPGADGRRARAGRREWDALSHEVERGVLAYWDGAQADEPLRALHGDQRAQLLARARDLSDTLVRHICAVIEGTDGASRVSERASLLGALRNAGDRRLVPALRAVIQGHESELVIPAVRAISRIDDPRVHPILKAAYERTPTAQQRLVLGAGLGMSDDARGLAYAREVLQSHDQVLTPFALEVLSEVGTYDDVQAVSELLSSDDIERVISAVQTLGHIGDGRALLALAELRRTAARSGLRAEIEEAESAIAARMELLGEEPPSLSIAVQAFDTTKMAAIVKQRDPALVRLRARWSQIVGYAWLTIGARTRAIARFEMAAALRSGWAAPVLTVALMYARDLRSAQALAAFRRALEIDRRAVENNPIVVRVMAQSFLRRAEAVERDGRADIAYGLLQEVLALDLRKAPSGLRFALSERFEALRERAS